jgi:hypothetical protein
MRRPVVVLSLVSFMLCVQLPAADTVTVDHRLFAGLAHMDGIWAALTVARDGKVYIGLAYHGGDGHIVCFDPVPDRVIDLGNLTQLCGESALRRGPQSKIHAKFGEGKDGRLYFGTHAGYWWNYARLGTKEGYPGAHWMAYDPKTGKTEDFGIGLRYEGINTGAYDPLFNRIYGLTHPRGHFVYFDVSTRKSVDMGRVNNWESICRTLGVDDEGNVYGNSGAGQIYKYDPRTDQITELPLRVPTRPKGVSLGRDYAKSETHWRTVIWDDMGKRFYGVDESASLLFSFEPRVGPQGEVRHLGQLSTEAAKESRDIPYATLTLTLGLDRKLYYAIPQREFDYGGSSGAGVSHLITYDLKSGKTEDRGEMRLKDGRAVIGLNAAHTAPDGTIYFVGAIELREEPGKQLESAGRIGNTPYRLALVFLRPSRK